MMRSALVLPGMSKATLGSGIADAGLVRDADEGDIPLY